jgi:hypothetical protein
MDSNAVKGEMSNARADMTQSDLEKVQQEAEDKKVANQIKAFEQFIQES